MPIVELPEPSTKAVRYTQPLLGAVPGTDALVQVDQVAEVLIRQGGVARTVYGSNDKAALSNPVPRGVLPGDPGVSTRGELLVYLEAGRGYDAVVTVGVGSEAVVTVVPLPDISPDVADAGGTTVAAGLAALEAALPETYADAALSNLSSAATARGNLGVGRKVPGTYVLDDYGTITRDGTGDNTAAVNAAHAAMYGAARPGGTLDWGHGVIKCTGKLTLPSGTPQGNGATTQPTIIWKGRGGYNSGQETAPEGGTQVILTYQGASYNDAKVVTVGQGLFVLEDLSLIDTTADSSTPFVYTTNTTVKARRVAVIGATSGSGCQQDAFVFGGTKKPLTSGYGDADSGFQGYGSSVKDCYFDKVRRGVYGRSYANAVVVADNFFGVGCGTNLAGGAQVEFDGSLAAVESGSALGDYCTADVIRGNCFAGGSTFTYRVKLKKASGCIVSGNSSFDSGGSFVALCRLEHHVGLTDSVDYPSLLNKIVDNFATNGVVLSQDAKSLASGWNTLIGGGQGEGHILSGNVRLGGLNPVEIASAKFTAGSGLNVFQPDIAGESGFATRLVVKRSASEGSNPSGIIAQLFQNGTFWLGGAGAGNISFLDEAGVAMGSFSNNAKTWAAAGGGGGMLIDSGSGGSNVDVKGFALRLKNFLTDAVVHTLTVNGVGLNGNAAVAKAAAIASPTSDTVGTKAAIDALRIAVQAVGITA